MGEGGEDAVIDEGVLDKEVPTTISGLLDVLIYNPINATLLLIILFLIFQLFGSRKEKAKPVPTNVPLPRLKKQDMTAQQLRKYDGTNEDGRVCVAVNGKIFDCTKGKRYYGPGAPYAAFAGRDASRGFATFSVEASDLDYDDLSDLTTMQMDSVKEWEMQFQERYEYVGRLLKPGEEPTDYSEEEDASTEQSSPEIKKDKSQEETSKETLDSTDDKVFQQTTELTKNVSSKLDSIKESSKPEEVSPEVIASGEPVVNPSEEKTQ